MELLNDQDPHRVVESIEEEEEEEECLKHRNGSSEITIATVLKSA